MAHLRRRLLGAAILMAALIAADATSALAYWSSGAAGIGSGPTDQVNAATAPSAAGGAAQAVGLTWALGSTAAGHALTGYRIARFTTASGGSPVAATGGCAAKITLTHCTEQNVSPGTWYYAITPILNSWTGPQSPRSPPVVVTAATLTFTTTGTSPGGTLTGGTLTGFGAAETTNFHLDSVTGPVLGTTPSTVTTDSSGAAGNISLTLPASTTTGPHTVFAVGASSALTASTPITITAAPSVSFTGATVVAGHQVTGGTAAQFAPGETLTLHLDTAGSPPLSTTPATITADSTGAAAGFSATIPAATTGGAHLVYAVGSQSGRNASTSVAVTAADTTPPNAPVISFPATGGSYNTGWTGTVTGTASDTTGGSGIANTQVAISNGAGQYWNGTSFANGTLTWLTTTGTNNNTTWTYALAKPAEGSYTVQARSTDAQTNTGATATAAFTIDTTAPTVTSVVVANGAGSIPGTADANDTVTVTFSERIDATTFCSSWTNNGQTQTLTGATAQLLQGGSNDTIGNVSVTVQTGCGGQLDFGTVNTGGDYLHGGTAVFTGSTVTWNPAARALTLTLGTVTPATSGGIVSGVTPGKANGYAEPATGLKDLAGNYMSGDTPTTHAYTYTSGGVSTGF